MEGLMGFRGLSIREVLFQSSAVCLLACSIVLPNQATGDTLSDKAIRIQQEALIWTTDYEGLVDGKMGGETTKAIKKFQSRLGNAPTGTLTSPELEALVKDGFAKRTAAGFRQYTDHKSGVSVGIPENLLPAPKDVSWGKSWDNSQKGLAIDTLRFKNDVSLRSLYEKLLSINNRTISYQRYVDDSWFVIAAFERDAAVYVRADLVRAAGQPDEIRGFSIWMGKKRPDWYQSIPPAMLSSFRSNTDTSRDVSPNVFEGGPMGKTDNVRSIGPKLIQNDPPPRIEPIAASGQASSVTSCVDYKGLGDCPSVLTAK
jgi:peptidoglycan hydrolase-like protein with peptidoglycan-binding domain